jgi:PAS domain S-box-containing protein
LIRLTTSTCIGALNASHDARLVVLSVFVAAVASFAALTLAARARSALAEHRRLWLFVAAMALGGGIWTMHFVAMLAFRLPIAVAYDPGETIASILFAIGVVAVGFWYVDRAEGAWRSWFVAGPIVGVGVAIMHYTGMSAMRMQATTVYDAGLFALSVGIAVVAATAALAIAFTVRGMWLRVVAALVMAAAIAGMHYTGMAAAQFLPDPSAAATLAGVDRVGLGLAVAGVFLVCASLALLSVWIEHRLGQREAATIRRSEQRFRSLLQHTTDVILLLDRDGTVLFESGPVAHLLGAAAGTLEGRRLDEVAPGAHALCTLIERVAAEGVEGMLRRDIALALPDGQRVVLEATVQDESTDPVLCGWLVQLHDVSEARVAAERLAAARDAAERGDRAKTEFLGSISHELRTPIHIALGFSEMLRDDAERLAPMQIAEFATEIHASIERLMHIVGDLIELSRLEADQLLDEDITDAQRLLEAAARRQRDAAAQVGLALVMESDAVLPIRADERKLVYALWHLIGNAIKFSGAGVEIQLGAHAEGDGSVRLWVRDHGVGMSDAELARVTDDFTQIDGSYRRSAEGLGLGLSLARRIAERHGGRLEIESALQQGTRVSIVLPAARAAADMAHRQHSVRALSRG